MRFAFAILIGATICVRPAAQGIPDAMQRALAGGPTKYAGTRTVVFNRPNGKRSHVEYVSHLNDKSRVEFPKDSPMAGQIIVEDAQSRQQYFPRRNEIETAPPRNEIAAGRLRSFVKRVLKGRWRVGSENGGPVAGISTETVWFQDQRGVMRERFWIDPRNGMILRRSVNDPSGMEMAGFEYTQLDYNPPLAESNFVLKLGARLVTPADKARRIAMRNGFKALFLPTNSSYVLESSQMIHILGKPTLNEVFNGPGGKVSLFRLHSEIDPQKLRKLAQGRYRVKTWARNGETFALVGDIDEQSLGQFARELGGE